MTAVVVRAIALRAGSTDLKTMNPMGWSQASMLQRYQRPDDPCSIRLARKVGAIFDTFVRPAANDADHYL